jgi:hypothetical protein
MKQDAAPLHVTAMAFDAGLEDTLTIAVNARELTDVSVRDTTCESPLTSDFTVSKPPFDCAESESSRGDIASRMRTSERER